MRAVKPAPAPSTAFTAYSADMNRAPAPVTSIEEMSLNRLWHCAPRPQRPLPPRDRVRDLGLVVIERGVAPAPVDRATVHSVHRARRDREPSRLRQANLLTEPDPWWFLDSWRAGE